MILLLKILFNYLFGAFVVYMFDTYVLKKTEPFNWVTWTIGSAIAQTFLYCIGWL